MPQWLPWVLYTALGVVLFGSFIFGDSLLYGTDIIPGALESRANYLAALKELGYLPGWQPGVLGGVPALESLTVSDTLYPPSFLAYLLADLHRALGWRVVIHVVAAGFLTFLWLRCLGVSGAGALVAGAGYMLAPVFVSLVFPGHDAKIFVTTLAPLLFWATERHFQRPSLANFTAIALIVAATLLTPHFQMAYFLFGATGAFAVFRGVCIATRRPGGPRRASLRFSTFLGASVVGALIVSGFLIPAFDHVTNWSRRTATSEADPAEAVAWSSSWSIHPEEALGLIIPEFPGANTSAGDGWSSDTYWGRNAFKLNSEYAGLVLLVLAAASFGGGARRRTRWFFVGLGATALLFSLGTHTPVWRVFYEVIPGISLFRAPSQSMYLFALAAATLAGFGVDRLLSADRKQASVLLRRLLYAVAFLGAGALLAQSGILTSVWTSTIYSGIAENRYQALSAAMPYIQKGAWISLLLVGSVAALVWGRREKIIGSKVLLGGLLVLAVLDPIRIDRAFIHDFDYNTWAAPSPNIRAVLERERGGNEPFRMLSYSDRGQDVIPAFHGIELASGHHPNDLARYRELVGMPGSSDPLHLYQNANIRKLLNVRYVLWPDAALRGSIEARTDDFRRAGYWPPAPAGAPMGATIVSRTGLGDGRPYETVLAVPGLPRARLVTRAVVKSDEEAVPYMLSPAFDPALEAVLAEPAPVELDGAPVTGGVRWTERGPDRMVLAVQSDRPALLVVADNWYPGWRSAVNGEEADVLRAYHTLRAVPVPSGESTVEMWYESGLAKLWFRVGMAVLAGLVVLNVLNLIRARRTKTGS